jgi:hypothetical protein
MTTYRGEISTPDLAVCIHCGDPIRGEPVLADGKPFCCNGCRVVYDILSQSDTCPVPIPQPVGSSRFESG